MLNVPVVMLVAAAAVLVGVIVVAMGRGGELAYFQSDYAPLKLDEVSATDVALLRPPTALWGYNMQATDEALARIANALTERDIEISALQQQVADLEALALRRRGYPDPGPAARRNLAPSASREGPPPVSGGGPPSTPRYGPPSSGAGPATQPEDGDPPSVAAPGAADTQPSGPRFTRGPFEALSSSAGASVPWRSPSPEAPVVSDDDEEQR